MTGCTPRELAILDRADAGMSADTVRKVIHFYNDGVEADRLWRRAAEMSNRAYLKAIAATGRGFA